MWAVPWLCTWEAAREDTGRIAGPELTFVTILTAQNVGPGWGGVQSVKRLPQNHEDLGLILSSPHKSWARQRLPVIPALGRERQGSPRAR